MSEQPFQPTITQMLYGAEAGSYDVPDWADDMFVGMLREWERVYWNIHQEKWEPHACTIGTVTFQPYVWDGCDCGGREIQHKTDCRWLLEHSAWNSRRIDALCGPPKADPTKEELDSAYQEQGPLGPYFLIMESCSRDASGIRDIDKSEAWCRDNPPPVCTCGESDGWEERDCAEQCISRKPNYGIAGDVIQIRWYKYPHRGMSVTVPLTPEQWIDWRNRVDEELKRAEHDHQLARYRAYGETFKGCPVYYSRCRFCVPADTPTEQP